MDSNTQSKLDHLLEEVRNTATKHPGTDTVNKLLQSARALIELSESINDALPSGTSAHAVLKEPFLLIDATKDRKTRAQEEHVNPFIQQQLSRSLYEIRRVRDRVFGGHDLFADPAWDIMLDLVYAERDNKSVSVSSAGMASCVPPTTALRWISILESWGYVERVQDPLDGRRRYLILSEKGRVMMNRFFAQVIRRQLL